jgi:hypothetical protein
LEQGMLIAVFFKQMLIADARKRMQVGDKESRPIPLQGWCKQNPGLICTYGF